MVCGVWCGAWGVGWSGRCEFEFSRCWTISRSWRCSNLTRSAPSPTSLVNACLDGCKHRHGTCHAGQCFGSRGNRGAADESKRRAHPGPRRPSVSPFFSRCVCQRAARAIAEAWRPHGHAQLSGQPQTLSSRQKADTWWCKCSTATGLVVNNLKSECSLATGVCLPGCEDLCDGKASRWFPDVLPRGHG